VYTPTARLLTLLELLQARGRLSGAELAARLEVDGRTVRRYITTLQDLGIPIDAVRGRGGAYRLRPGFKLPPLIFTDDEALALILGLLAARRLGLAATAPAVEGALAKVERVLPVAVRERVRAVADTLQFDLRPTNAVPAGGALTTLSTAARAGQRVTLRYRASETDAETTRPFDPFGIVHREGQTYAVGYCHMRAAIRVFRLDRIVAVEPREERFARPADFDPLAATLHTLATVPRGLPVAVLLHTTLALATARFPAATAVLTETPEGILVSGETSNPDWFAHVLLGVRCPLTVLGPPELRAALRELGERAVAAGE
jgi:predicted DNA-binding transcriptional regulator YafY